MKTILGLDLGVSSIGWALIKTDDDTPADILGMGVRIIPLTTDDEKEFTQGNAISKNQNRTTKRTQRKGLDRYQLRRKALEHILKDNGLLPDKRLLLELSPLEIWGMRARAVTEKVTLKELGRVLLHLNQKRGYKHSKTDVTEDTKQTEYVQAVNNRYSLIKSQNQTIGQHFYTELRRYFAADQKEDVAIRIKEKVFPRIAYEEEFDLIWKKQKEFYSSVLTDELHHTIRNEIIYYQRRLKSQKNLVCTCEFETKTYLNKDGKLITAGPKVTPKSSPLFQIEKIWESINNITVKNKNGEQIDITRSQKQEIFNYLDYHVTLSQNDLFSILKIGKNDGYFTNALIRTKGIQGNLTKTSIAKVIGVDHPALNFDLSKHEIINKDTGEIVSEIISPDLERQPLYQLWHIIYSIDNDPHCISKLKQSFGFDDDTAKKLASLDFSKGGFGNKSSKAIRKLLPYLEKGFTYDKACTLAGYNHSDSITKDENLERELQEKLDALPKNSLRQPVVEKILNQMINLVNAVIVQYGRPDIIRVELARELKQSREERNNTYNNINKKERKNKEIEHILLEHPEFRKKNVSKRDIERYRLWEEFKMISPYEPNKIISIGELYSGEYDFEHIIPRSLRFDDSFSNKTICRRIFNSGEVGKNNFTAYDYMKAKRSKEDFETYITFIEKAFKDKNISKTKYENLLRKGTEIPSDFINRQLNESRYIARKATGILKDVCYHVYTTSGTVTQRLRELWGWNYVLEELNIPKYRGLNLTELIDVTHNDQVHQIERIKNWSKREDHRHHAIDALAIACTQQSFIHRINTLNSQQTRHEIKQEVVDYVRKLSLLDNYLLKFKPFDTDTIKQHAAHITISFKPGKKSATLSRRIISKGDRKEVVQRKIVTPRGALSEESVYGKVKRKISRNIKLDKNFDIKLIPKILDTEQRRLVSERLKEADDSPAIAFKNLKKNPILTIAGNELTQVIITDFQDEFVIRYSLSNITMKDIDFVVDKAIRSKIFQRLKEYNGNHKEAWKELEKRPLWHNSEKFIPIKKVRCFTGIGSDSVVPIKVQDDTWGIEYLKYVKPANNHHIAIYKDENGKLCEHTVTFWHAVERKKYGIPVIIKSPKIIWDDIMAKRELPDAFLEKLPSDKWTYITSMQQNECFVFNMDQDELREAIDKKEYFRITPNIFRVRKLTSGAYWLNHQYETTPKDSLIDKKAGRCIQASLNSMKGIKIKIDMLGQIHLE